MNALIGIGIALALRAYMRAYQHPTRTEIQQLGFGIEVIHEVTYCHAKDCDCGNKAALPYPTATIRQHNKRRKPILKGRVILV